MGRTPLFRNIQRALRIARDCERAGISTREALEREAQWSRRSFVRAAASAAALGATGCGLDVGSRDSSLRLSGNVGIVGAGIAGLACATELARYGLRPTIHEASDRAGGRIWSLGGAFAGPVSFAGQVAERGGELIDTGHTTMRGYARSLGLTLETYIKRPGETTYYFGGTHYSEEVVVDEFRALVPAMHEDLRSTSGGPTADSFSEGDRVLDFTTLEEWLDTRGAGSIARTALDVAYTIEYGVETDRQSCLGLLFFIHADRRSRFEPFGVFSDERFHVVEGNQAIPQGLAASLADPIRFGRRLVAARKRSDGRIELTMSQGGSLRTYVHDIVVFAIPFSVLREVDLDPSLELPAWKLLAIDELQYGTNSKMLIGFDGAPWEALGSNGSSYSDLGDHQNTWETNYTRATPTSAVLTDYSGGDRGARLDPRNPIGEANRFLTALDRVWPGASARVSRDRRGRPARVHLEHWASNPFSRGSYTANQPGYFTTIAGNEGKPVGNVLFAGEHTNSFYEWQGFMEGAALSGIEAAGQAVNLLR
jgi:monoamine oxidase